MLVEIEAQSSVEAMRAMLAPLSGPARMGHASPQVSEAHGTWDPVADAEVYTVVVSPVTEHPLVVTVVKVEQVVVEMLALNTVGAHRMVTFNAVSWDVHVDAEEEEVDNPVDVPVDVAEDPEDPEDPWEALFDGSEFG